MTQPLQPNQPPGKLGHIDPLYFKSHRHTLRAAALIGFYEHAKPIVGHAKALDTAFQRHKQMFGEPGIPERDARAIVDAHTNNAVKVHRCKLCECMYLDKVTGDFYEDQIELCPEHAL